MKAIMQPHDQQSSNPVTPTTPTADRSPNQATPLPGNISRQFSTSNNFQLNANKTAYVVWFGSVVVAAAFGWLISKNIAVSAILGGITLVVAISKGLVARKGAQIKDGILTFTDESEGLNGKKIEVNISDINLVYLGNQAKFSETVGIDSGNSNIPSVVLAGLISPAAAGGAAAREYTDMFFVVTKDNIVHKFSTGPYSKNNCRRFLECLRANGVTTFVKAGLL